MMHKSFMVIHSFVILNNCKNLSWLYHVRDLNFIVVYVGAIFNSQL